MKVFIGYDLKEDIAYNVCDYSINKNSSIPLEVKPLRQADLRELGYYWRAVDEKGSTEFTFTRFLVPVLAGYQGWVLFCDSDFLWLDDVKNLFDQIDDRYAVMLVKHNYTPTSTRKKINGVQYQYPRKNWSSMVLWNCGHEKNSVLTPELINTAPAEFLHRFSWLKEEDIGEIDKKWNWLVNWYQEPRDGTPSALHFTEGGPWIESYQDCQYSDKWKQYKNDRLLNQ